MWMEKTLGNQIRIIVYGDASELFTITRGVAQGNTRNPITLIIFKKTITK